MNTYLFKQGQQVQDPFLLRQFEEEEVGVFETLRVYNGCIFQEDEHLDRFLESAKSVGLQKRINARSVSKELHMAMKTYASVAKGKKDHTVMRVSFIQDEIFVMVGERKPRQSLYKKGVVLRTSPVMRATSNASLPEAKSTAYQNAVLATLEPSEGKIYEWLMLDQSGYVTETRVGNLFIGKRGSELWTPPSQGILNGVTRKFVIQCALRLGVRVKEVPMTRHDIYTAQEAFLTNTTWEILPIRILDGRKIGDHIPGILSTKLQNIFKQRIRKACQR